MDELRFYVLFNNILVISGRWEVDNERLCAEYVLWKGYPLEARITPQNWKLLSVQIFWARLASFGQLGHISDPQISSKLPNGINDPRGLKE